MIVSLVAIAGPHKGRVFPIHPKSVYIVWDNIMY